VGRAEEDSDEHGADQAAERAEEDSDDDRPSGKD
jgi:hypothetical protein